MDVLLPRDVAGDAARVRMGPGDGVDVFGGARNEGHLRAAAAAARERARAQTGRAAGDGHSRTVEGIRDQLSEA